MTKKLWAGMPEQSGSENRNTTSLSISYPANPVPTPVPQILLLGDSITEQGVVPLQALLQSEYIRRADVLNRGFSGFTSTNGLLALRKVLPAEVSLASPRILFVTIWFGANDATLPGESQHVPLDIYKANLREITLQSAFKRGGTKFALITPPPVNEFQFVKNPATERFQRTATNTARYAQAVRDVAEELDLPLVDIWKVLLKRCGWKESDRIYCCQNVNGADHGAIRGNGQAHVRKHLPGCSRGNRENGLTEYLRDGLHFTDKAYEVLREELWLVIRRDIASCAPENLPYVISDWKDFTESMKPVENVKTTSI